MALDFGKKSLLDKVTEALSPPPSLKKMSPSLLPSHVPYTVQTLILTTAFVEKQIDVKGRSLMYMGPNDGPTLSVQFSAVHNNRIEMNPGDSIVINFSTLYISAPATLLVPVLLIGQELTFDISDNTRQVKRDWELEQSVVLGSIYQGYVNESLVVNTREFQVWNPAGSNTKVVVLGAMICFQTTGLASTFSIIKGRSDVQRVNFYRNVVSLKSDLPGVTELRMDFAPGVLPQPYWAGFVDFALPSIPNPLIIPCSETVLPDHGLGFQMSFTGSLGTCDAYLSVQVEERPL